MLILGLAMLALTGDPDGVVTTGRATPLALDATTGPVAPTVEANGVQDAAHGLTTDQQIDRWLADRSPETQPFAGEVGVKSDDRKVHGYAEAGIGTGGYRAYGGGVSLPIGEEGRLDLHYRKVEGERAHGYPGYGYDHGVSAFDTLSGRFGAAGRSTSFGASARWDGDGRRAWRDDED